MSIEQIELGNLIRKKRRLLGLTLSDLAGENISVPTISNIERGVVNNVSNDKVTYLLDKLGLDKHEINELRKLDSDEREVAQFELSIIFNLIETNIFDIAREQILTLDKKETITDNADLAIKLQLARAHLYRRQKQWDRAARALRKVIQMAGEATLDTEMNIEAEAYCYLAQCVYHSDEDYEQALRYCNSALSVFDQEGENLHLEGRIYYDKAIYHYHLEAYAPAYDCIRKSKELSENTKDMRLVVMAYNMEGTILKKQKMYSKAIPLFKKAIDMSAALYPDQSLAANLYLNLGDNYYYAERYEEATYCFNIAEQLCLKAKEQRLLALVYNSFSEVYFITGEHEKATMYSDKAMDLAKKHNTALDYLQILKMKADIELFQDLDTVVKTCREGVSLADKTKQFEKKKDFHFLLAKYYNKIGDEEQFMQETKEMFNIEALIQGREFK